MRPVGLQFRATQQRQEITRGQQMKKLLKIALGKIKYTIKRMFAFCERIGAKTKYSIMYIFVFGDCWACIHADEDKDSPACFYCTESGCYSRFELKDM